MELVILGAGAGIGASAGSLALGLGIASAATGVLSGYQQKQASETQADQARLNARLESLQGQQQALDIQRALRSDLASQEAMFAARGVLQGEGSAMAAQSIARQNANASIDSAMFNASMRRDNAMQRASNLEQQGQSAFLGSIAQGIGTIGSAYSLTGTGSAYQSSNPPGWSGPTPYPAPKPWS